MAPRQRVQGLNRVVANADVDEVLLDELPDSGEVGIIDLLIEYRPAVASEAAGAAVGGLGKEKPCTALLPGGQRSVVPGDEPIERRLPGDHRAPACRRLTTRRHIIHELCQVIRGSGISSFLREGFLEQLDESRNL